MNVERHEIEQFAIAHLGEQEFRAALQHILHQLLLRFDQLVDTVLDRATADKLMHQDVPLLADTKRTVSRLIFHGRVPPAIVVDHMGSGGEIQTRPTRLEREHEKGRQLIFLESLDQFPAPGYRSATMEHQTFATKD